MLAVRQSMHGIKEKQEQLWGSPLLLPKRAFSMIWESFKLPVIKGGIQKL